MKFLLGFITGVIAGLAGFFAFAWISGGKMVADSRDRSPELIIRKAETPIAFNLDLRDLRSGSRISTEDFRNKVVFLNFWEHWCTPCRIEMPSINKLYKQVGDSTIVFAVVSTDKPDAVKKDKVMEEFNLPFYHLENMLPPELDGGTVPRTMIIDKRGNLVVTETGMANWYDRKVIQFLDSLKAL